MGENLAHAVRNLFATWGAGVALVGCFFVFSGLQHWMGAQEVQFWPVLNSVTICEGPIDKATGACLGEVVTYKDFQQTAMSCDGRDAIVSGTLSKVRSDAKYVEGKQVIYFGSPDGKFRRTVFDFLDDSPNLPSNRPPGVQEWGPWRLSGGCVTEYTTWFTTVEHRPWHQLWNLATTVGPFPLPRAKVVS